MEISFDNKRTRKLLESEKDLRRTFGAKVAKAVMKIMALLRAVDNLFELRQWKSVRIHELKRERVGQFAVSIKEGNRLLLVPDHDPVPTRSDGRVDWNKIRRITIVGIVDYHD